MHCGWMRTAHSLPYGGSLTETPSDRDSPDGDPLPPGQRPPPWTETETPPPVDIQRLRPPCGQTDTYENITFANSQSMI